MTQVVRWDPFAEFHGLRRAMDRLFDDFGPARSVRGEQGELTFPVDIAENDSDIVVKAVLPGVKADDVEITVSEGVLTIRGESRTEETTDKENYHRREIRYGAFARSMPLPARVDQDQADAEFKDGLLTVRLPKAEDARPRSIKVKGAAPELAGATNSQN
ncbi:MAG TPA: Hsp20/alpha crystallin family protein [Dehalococcoidia bacterium]|nr:Hsp20/alpha crystallin family protein [Dehalococcoidia bacterium]